jgi:hypothetical protein
VGRARGGEQSLARAVPNGGGKRWPPMMGRWCGAAAGRHRRLPSGPARPYNTFFYLFKCFQTDSNLNQSKRWLSGARKISNKICNCRELNMEQLFLLELFKIQNRIGIKNLRTFMSQICLNLNFMYLKGSELGGIWPVGL